MNIKKGQVHAQLSKAEVAASDDKDELHYIHHQNLPDLSWKTCLLIDSESNVDIFNSSELLTDIHKAKNPQSAL